LARVHEDDDQAQQSMVSSDPHVETTPRKVAHSDGRLQRALEVRRQHRVGVQEYEERAAGACGPGIELQGAAAWRLHHLIGQPGGDCDGGVKAATIGHQNFHSVATRLLQGSEGCADTRFLIERGNDDRYAVPRLGAHSAEPVASSRGSGVPACTSHPRIQS
jgi:hypothetical protein